MYAGGDRFAHKTPASWDDWLIVPAMLLTVALGGVMIWGEWLSLVVGFSPILVFLGVVDNGLGRSTPTSKTLDAENQKVEYIFLCLELLGFGLVKLSVIFFCRRIFCDVFKNNFDMITKFLITLVIIWSVGFTFAMIFECGTSFWALFSTAENLVKNCAKTLKLAEAFVISDVITDLMILCLPLPMVWRLQMSTRRKISATGVFLLGSFATAASIARMIVYLKYVYSAYPPPDRDLTITELLFWSLIELGIGVLAACLPTLRLLFTNTSLSSPSLNTFLSPFSPHTSLSGSFRVYSAEQLQHLRSRSYSSSPQLQIPPPSFGFFLKNPLAKSSSFAPSASRSRRDGVNHWEESLLEHGVMEMPMMKAVVGKV
ncbi:hypothetical protein MMC07_007755 [Pseudocyphellaria aurata]|nr:hypothetical protein [Pseudocyphellaria aurata]